MATCSELLPRHSVSMRDFSQEAMEALFAFADRLRTIPPSQTVCLFPGKVIAILFYQPSTRTRLNFHAAVGRLGATAIGFADVTTTRAGDFYRESLEDVIRFTASISDIIVLRNSETGAVKRLVPLSPVPLINAGDGYNEHPTQALGDIYTMHLLLGNLSGKRLGFVGDLRVRSLRSILIGMRHYAISEYLFLLPPGCSVTEDVKSLLAGSGARWRVVDSVKAMIEDVDIIETIGINHPNHERPLDIDAEMRVTDDRYRITEMMIRMKKGRVFVLHPGPRTDEIEVGVDALSEAAYFDQARNGMWIRMALLAAMLYRREIEPEKSPGAGDGSLRREAATS